MAQAITASQTEQKLQIGDSAPELGLGSVWLREQRRRLQLAFNQTAFPRRGLHDWRFTDPAKFLIENGGAAPAPAEATARPSGGEPRILEDTGEHGLAVDYAGREVRLYGADWLARKGIILARLSDAVEEHRALVERYMYRIVDGDTGALEAMNGALFNDGIFLYVPDGVVVEHPVRLLHAGGAAESVCYPRVLAVAGKNAELTLIDEYTGGAGDPDAGVSVSIGVVELFGMDESRVRYIPLQRQAAGARSYLTHRARIGRGASMLTIPLVLGAETTKQNFGVKLDGEGAESYMYGLLFGSDYQHLDNHTLHHHAAGRTRSNIDFKVAVRDRAVSAYTGLIRIEKGAKNCEAYQENRNLLLNKGARAESIPELEILNEEVMCTHGATVGPLDPLLVFYLNSRGIRREDAVRMIVSGFIDTTLSRIPDDLKEQIRTVVINRLEDI